MPSSLRIEDSERPSLYSLTASAWNGRVERQLLIADSSSAAVSSLSISFTSS